MTLAYQQIAAIAPCSRVLCMRSVAGVFSGVPARSWMGYFSTLTAQHKRPPGGSNG